MKGGLLLSLVLAIVVCFASGSHVFKGKAHLGGRDITAGLRANADAVHRVIFMVNQRNLEKLDDVLMSVSDPDSADYGKHWTRAQVGEFTANPTASAKVLEYLEAHHSGAYEIVGRSLYDEYIVVTAKMHIWENMFNTKFFEFRHAHWKMQTIHRAMEYAVPTELQEHVYAVGNVIDFPSVTRAKPIYQPADKAEAVTPNAATPKAATPTRNLQDANYTMPSNMVDPAFLAEYYNIPSTVTGTERISQMVYSSIDQTLSTFDLETFQLMYNVPVQQVSQTFHEHVNVTCDNIDNCVEANLDFQYLMSTARGVPTVAYYDGNSTWYDWLLEVNTWNSTPNVITMSYGSLEMFISNAEYVIFNYESSKLGIMGTTLIVASGDDGAPNFGVAMGLSCGYYPDFPSGSKYWTSVGGTAGPEYGNAEQAASSRTNAWISSGGGFSDVVPTPSWQAAAVSSYLNTHKTGSANPRAGFNTQGRGYPDVSLLAHRYAVVVNASVIVVDGTSASAPVFAGMVSLANAQRVRHGKSKLGFLNPLLYAKSGKFARDVTGGDNKCTSFAEYCCAQGFTAISGWDPITGLGSVDATNFIQMALGRGTNTPTVRPTRAPTRRPTHAPTRSTTRKPTVRPTRRPTVHPTRKPTRRPTTVHRALSVDIEQPQEQFMMMNTNTAMLSVGGLLIASLVGVFVWNRSKKEQINAAVLL